MVGRSDALLERLAAEIEELGSLVERMLRGEPLPTPGKSADRRGEAGIGAGRGAARPPRGLPRPRGRDPPPARSLSRGVGCPLAGPRSRLRPRRAAAAAARGRGRGDRNRGRCRGRRCRSSARSRCRRGRCARRCSSPCPMASRGAVTAIHLFEHLEPETLLAVLAEIRRVLRPGGELIIESPNPHSLRVGASLYWVDPTHRRPLMPETLELYLKTCGFEVDRRELLHPFPADQLFADARREDRTDGDPEVAASRLDSTGSPADSTSSSTARATSRSGRGNRNSLQPQRLCLEACMKNCGLAVVMLTMIITGCGATSEAPVDNDGLTVRDDIVELRAQFVPADPDRGDRCTSPTVTRRPCTTSWTRPRPWTRSSPSRRGPGNPSFASEVGALEGPERRGRPRLLPHHGRSVGSSRPPRALPRNEPPSGRAPATTPRTSPRPSSPHWIEAHPEDREAFTSLHTLIRRDGDELVAVPYSEAFAGIPRPRRHGDARRGRGHRQREPQDASSSSGPTPSPPTTTTSRTWRGWISIRAIEVVIGPYETYEDSLFGYKAAFECFLCVAQPEDSARLEVFKSELPFLEAESAHPR